MKFKLKKKEKEKKLRFEIRIQKYIQKRCWHAVVIKKKSTFYKIILNFNFLFFNVGQFLDLPTLNFGIQIFIHNFKLPILLISL